MCVGLVLLASSTAFDIFSDVGRETGPPEFGSNPLLGFKVARVSSRFVVMTLFKNGMMEGVVIRDIDTSLISENTGFMFPVREMGAEGKKNGTFHRLEGLKYKGVIDGG